MMGKNTLTSTTDTIQVHDLFFTPYISEATIREKVESLGRQLSAKFENKCPLFINVLNGSFVFAADLVRACGLTCEVSFIKIASYKGLNSTGQTQTLIGLSEDIEGRHIIILEDIVDSGRTLYEFLQQLRQQNPASITVVALLVKPEAKEYNIPLDYVGFNIPNAFVIGYGLDYNGLGRNLKGIYQLANQEK